MDNINQRIADEIQMSGTAFIKSRKVHGRVVIRLSICLHRSTLEDIELVIKKLKEIGSSLV